MKHVRMTVGQLKKLLADVPDDTPVLGPSSDHSYRPVVARIDSGMLDKKWGWSEDFRDLNPPEMEQTSVRKRIVVITSD